jgi:hypothetical protein
VDILPVLDRATSVLGQVEDTVSVSYADLSNTETLLMKILLKTTLLISPLFTTEVS